MYLLQKSCFESLYRDMTERRRLVVFVGVFRYATAAGDRWILAMTLQANYWFLGAQRGGLRQFRHLDTAQKFVLEELGTDAFSVQGSYPRQFPDFDGEVGLSEVAA
ncbi:hypothetical protein LG302_02530 [Halomonas organivorans]